MKVHTVNFFGITLALFLLVSEFSQAQRKDIVISSELESSSEMLKVKMGTRWMNQIWNFRFGEYAVLKKSKVSPEISSQKSNLLGTKNKYEKGYNFYFTLASKTPDSAFVNALYSEYVEEVSSFELFPDFYLGQDEVLKDSVNFVAGIRLSSNKEELWKLTLQMKSGTEMNDQHSGTLTLKDRTVLIIPVSSNREGNDKRMFPALGYEFTENGKAICAVQYFGGGGLGYNKNRIWIDSSLQDEFKLVLAATMTAILQVKQPG